MCKLLNEGIAGIFGPQTPEAASHTQALCDKFDVPRDARTFTAELEHHFRAELGASPNPVASSAAA